MNYKNKYFKYKIKYLLSKKISGGADKIDNLYYDEVHKVELDIDEVGKDWKLHIPELKILFVDLCIDANNINKELSKVLVNKSNTDIKKNLYIFYDKYSSIIKHIDELKKIDILYKEYIYKRDKDQS